jgi:hypothetical protein
VGCDSKHGRGGVHSPPCDGDPEQPERHREEDGREHRGHTGDEAEPADPARQDRVASPDRDRDGEDERSHRRSRRHRQQVGRIARSVDEPAVDLVVVRIVAHRLDAVGDRDPGHRDRDVDRSAHEHDRREERPVLGRRLLAFTDPLADRSHEPDQCEQGQSGQDPADVHVRAIARIAVVRSHLGRRRRARPVEQRTRMALARGSQHVTTAFDLPRLSSLSWPDDPRYQDALKALPDRERRILEMRFVEEKTPATYQELEDLLGAIRALMRKVAEQNPPSRHKTRFWRRRGASRPRWRRRPRVLAGSLTALGLSRRKRRPSIAERRPDHGATLGPFDYPAEPGPEGGVGVREPRRPKLPGLSGAAALAIPDSVERAPGVTAPIDPFRIN